MRGGGTISTPIDTPEYVQNRGRSEVRQVAEQHRSIGIYNNHMFLRSGTSTLFCFTPIWPKSHNMTTLFWGLCVCVCVCLLVAVCLLALHNVTLVSQCLLLVLV